MDEGTLLLHPRGRAGIRMERTRVREHAVAGASHLTTGVNTVLRGASAPVPAGLCW